MLSKDIRAKYQATIGIECHVQLKTKTKLFSAVGNDAREAPPNTLVSHIDFGLPGALPVLNSEAVRLASKAAFALNSTPQTFSKFDRKHYFYPDLPMGYQISQFDEPIVIGGSVQIEVEGKPQKIGITRAHLEADAGKSTHQTGMDYSLVDLNRAGTPLLEIVSEPDMHSSAEVKAYAHELYLLMRYADVSEANLYYGNMRFDVNVSVSKTKELGTRSETKNLNSFRSVEKAVDFEINRQIELLEKGGRVVQETRGWDDAKQKTFSQRSKENADDYRYMPDPDLPPVILTKEYISKIKSDMPVMPDEIRKSLNDLGLDKSTTEALIENLEAAHFMLEVLSDSETEDSKRIANWLVGEVQALVAAEKVTWSSAKLNANMLRELSILVGENKLSSTGAKVVVGELVINGGDTTQIIKDKGLLQVSDEGEIAKIVEQVINENPQAAQDVKSGEIKAIGFLVGQVMKQSKGKANPGLAQKIIKQQLGV
jgi:aspartyl-tRNA(Asn)/glutamyl-tRNA(Gln) amidotransferase subunit B